MILRYKSKTVDMRQSLNQYIAGLLLLPLYIDLMATLSALMGFSTKITTYVYYGALWILLLLSMPQILKSITGNVCAGILIAAAFIGIQYILFPSSRSYITGMDMEDRFTFASKTLLSVVPYILVGAAVNDLPTLREMLHSSARVGIVMGTLSYLISIMKSYSIHYDDMSVAYAICVMICLLITDYRKYDIYFLIAGCLSLVLAGTRGPILCVLCIILWRVIFYKSNVQKRILKIILILIAIVILQSGLLLYLLELLADFFTAIGVKQLRIIDYVRSGMILDSSGRDEIADAVLQKIMENPIYGYGVGGDRIALRYRTYAHNIVLEMWVSYGVVIGTAILLWIAYWLIKGIRCPQTEMTVIVMGLSSGIVLKLLLSSSYLRSKELFLLLGICMAGCAAKRRAAIKNAAVGEDLTNETMA